MSDPDAPPLDVERLLAVLHDHGVDYLIVGGMAAVAYGSDRATFDIDVVPELTDTNLTRVGEALRELNAMLRLDDGSTTPFPTDGDALRQFEVSTWRTDAGDIDVIRGLPTHERGRLAGYEQLADDATTVEAFGLTIRLASLDAIIESKEALARPPDLEALPGLRRLRYRHQS